MRLTLLCILATAVPAFSVLAERHRGGGRFHGGGNIPNTFVTVASAAPAATQSAIAASSDNPPAVNSPSTGAASGAVDASLIPPFGITPGIQANDGSANCVGDGGKGIPCTCPPDLNTFVAAVNKFVAAGQPFPTGSSVADQLTRLETCIVTLQNFIGGAGSGVGCPAVSTTWKELRAQLDTES